MSNKTPTPVLVDTDLLSKIVSETLALVGAPASKKSACLNKIAAMIAGPKHNWGFLTGRKDLVQAQGVTATLSQPEPAADKDDIVLTGCLLAMHEYGIPLGAGSLDAVKWLKDAYLMDREEVAKNFRQAAEVSTDLQEHCAYLLGSTQLRVAARSENAAQAISEALASQSAKFEARTELDLQARAKAREDTEALIARLKELGGPVAYVELLQDEIHWVADALRQGKCTIASLERANDVIIETLTVPAPLTIAEDMLTDLIGHGLTQRVLLEAERGNL